MIETAHRYMVPIETVTEAEGINTSPFDAIHVIEYELNSLRKPNTPGLMGINTAAELIQAGISKNVIFSGTHYKGEDNSRISDIYATELQKRIGDLEGITIISEATTLPPILRGLGAKDTGGDVSFLQKQAKANRWKNILVIAYQPHAERIGTLLENRGLHIVTNDSPASSDGINVTIISSNDFQKSIHSHFEERFEASPYKEKEGTTFSDKEQKKLKAMNRYDRTGHIISIAAHLMPQWMKEKFQS